MNILIVGGGIAGTSLAQHLHEAGVEFKLVENGNNQSSLMAAGILNPLVFRRVNLSWRVEEFMPFAASFYKRMEEQLGTRFFYEKPIRRFFASEQEKGYWLKKQHEPVYSDYMKIVDEADEQFDSPRNSFGTGLVQKSAIVHAAVYLPAKWEWLKESGKLIEESFDYDQLDPINARYKGVEYDHIVFSQGKDGRHNPYFNYLPLQATKGELLTVKIPELSQKESLNRKCFLFPLGNEHFRVGSTYGWDHDNVEITEAARETIQANLDNLTDKAYTIVDQQAGVRPTTPDRRPFIGKHPEFPKLVIANGLGTKGFMTAPLLMQELAAHLLEGAELNADVSIARFNHIDAR